MTSPCRPCILYVFLLDNHKFGEREGSRMADDGSIHVTGAAGQLGAVGRVVIVGAGPAGAALAYLLARRGVEVMLLERHPDFERTFRGDGLQPSGVDAFDQMGFGERLRQLPRATINVIELYKGGRRRARL